jgi:hypothetical protein
MKIIVGLFIFCVTLFLYLHITFQLRTSNDLDIYEIDASSNKDRLEEICDVRQPVLFDYTNEVVMRDINLAQLTKRYPAFDVNMRSSREKDDSLYSPVPMRSAAKLFGVDNDKKYFSENNSLFLTDTGGFKSMSYHDEFLRPYMVSNCNYDVMLGSNGVTTPMRYEVNYRTYLYVTEGEIDIRFAPPKSTKYMMEHADYMNYEFRTPINPWNVQDTYLMDFDKVKCVDVHLVPGKMIYVPAYWWYSVKFGKRATIACFRYRTYMNNISILPRICMYFFQQQNLLHDGIKNKIGKEVTEEEIHENAVSTVDNEDKEVVKEEKNDTL